MEKRAFLVLRRQLIPDHSFDSSLDELIDLCNRVSIDAVCLFTLPQELCHPTTEPLDKAADTVPHLAKAGEALRKNSIGFQIQLIGVIGHGDFGAPKPHWATWQTMVGDDGTECAVCPCPLDHRYHEHLRQLIRIYAPLKPDVLWVDDDFRMQNHDPIDYACFCPDHLAEFTKRVGRQYSRAELVEAVLMPGTQPTEVRAVWMSLIGEDLERLAGIIQQELAEISPATRMGNMCSGIDAASIEGRDWTRMLKALCGPHRPVLRPTLCCYREPSAEELVFGIVQTKEQAFHFGKSADLWPELENYPYTRFSKSMRTSFLQMALSQLTGLNGITIDLHDFLGTSLAAFKDEEELLAKSRAFLDATSELVGQTGSERGIRLLSHQRQALHRRTDGIAGGYQQLRSPQPWAVTLPLMGFTTTYDEAHVVAMAGERICAYSNEEIEVMLSHGCLLDASAATALVERGYGKWIGIDSGELISGTFSGYLAEEIVDSSISGGETGRLGAWLASGSKYKLRPSADAQIVTHLVSAYGDPVPGLVVYENQQRGRVATVAYDGCRQGLGAAFRNWKRQRMLESLFEWLGRGPTPFFVRGAANVLPIRRDAKDFVLLGVANLSPDDVSETELVLGAIPIKSSQWKLSRLNIRGQLEGVRIINSKQADTQLSITCQVSIGYMDVAILVLHSSRLPSL